MMLKECVAWLTTPCESYSRQLGLLEESIAILSRYQRCQKAWQPHLDNTQQFLLQSANQADSNGAALVLGSGLLLDIPLAALAQRFEKVLLVDAVHQRRVRQQAAQFSNVECIQHDITEILADLYCVPTAVEWQQLAQRTPEQFVKDHNISWVASVNLISQLPLRAVDYSSMQFPGISDAELNQWGVQIMLQHIAYLRSFAAPGCIIADILQTTLNGVGEIIESTDFSPVLSSLGEPSGTWCWDIAPRGEIKKDATAQHKVGAWSLN